MTDGQTESRECLSTSGDHGRSISRHPLGGEPDFAEISNDVQFGRISWPVGAEIQRQPTIGCHMDDQATNDTLRAELIRLRKENTRYRNELSKSRKVAKMLLESHVDDPHARAGYEVSFPWIKRQPSS